MIVFRYNCLIPLAFTYFLVSLGTAQCKDYVIGYCHCFDEMDEELKSQKFDFLPRMGKYQYAGVRAVATDKYESCVCNDVTRTKTPFELTDNDARLASSSETKRKDLERTLVDRINKITKDDINYQNAEVTFQSSNATSNTVLNVEIAIKGHKGDPPSFILERLTALSQDIIETLGFTDEEKFNFTVLRCKGGPPAAPANGRHKWTTKDGDGFPGEVATYYCDENFVLEDVDLAFSECSHETLNWTNPEGNNNCHKGCSIPPPDAPRLTRLHSDVNKRKEGDHAKYDCIQGWKPITGEDGISTCRNNEWTKLPEGFTCEQIFCPKQVPKNVDHGRVRNFDSTKPLYIGTKIQYVCKNGFCSNYDEDIIVHCLKNGTWSELPAEYGCFPRVRTYCLTKEIQELLHKEYLASQANAPKNTFLLTVTIPCIIALGCLLFCAILVVRLDSPMYWCCSSKARMQNYRLDQY